MKSFIKRISIMLVLLSVLLTACGKTNTDPIDSNTASDDVKSIDLNGYTIIRGDGEDADVIAAVSSFYFKLFDEYKLDVSFGVDIEIKDKDKEIIFGATKRSTDKNHRYSDFSVDYKDGKIYVDGGSAAAFSAATEWLCNECIDANGVLSLENIPYEYNATYELENMKVCGVALSEFGFEEDGKGLTDEIKSWAGPKAGLRKTSPNGYTIRVVEDNTLYLNEVAVELVGKELILSASSYLDNSKVAADFFLNALKNCKVSELTFGESEMIDMPAPAPSVKDVRRVSSGSIGMSFKSLGNYKVGDEVIFVCTLNAGSDVVSCPEFTWTAKTADGKTYSGSADGSHGKAVIKLPATAAGEIQLKVLARDENGALIDCFEQSEEFDKDPVFSIVVKSTDDKSLYMKDIPDCFETTPIVYVVGTNYQIMVPVTQETLMWVEVDGKLFYDDVNGILRSNTTTHRMTVPQALLDGAGEYKICYRIVNERRPYNSSVSEVFEYVSVFNPVTSENPRFFSIADAHNNVDNPVAAAKAFGKIDFLILNGDIPNDAGNIKNFSTIHRIAAEITNGEIPVVFARGNHDMRGIYGENISEHTPTDNGNSYFTFRLGKIWGIVLDCGEDKTDSHTEYGSTVCCTDFRRRQIEFLNSVISNAENEYAASGVEYKMVVCHDPFTEYDENKPSAEDYTIYTEWARLLREDVKPDVMISGHVHQAYITNVGDELDKLGQACPVVVGSAPGTKISLASRGVWVKDIYVGTGFALNDDGLTVDFVGHNGIVYKRSVIA